MKLVGNKGNFAVEFEIVDFDRLMGYSKIWFGNNFIGTSEDLIYLESYLLIGLEKIGNAAVHKIDLVYNSEEDLYNYFNNRLLNSNDNGAHKYLVYFGSFCDDFTVFSFLQDNMINIIWRLHNNITPFKDLKNQNTSIKSFKIKKEKYLKELDIIKEAIMSQKECEM